MITGGNRGIGRAIVEQFLQKTNYRIVFTYRQRQQEAQELLDQYQSEHSRLSAFAMDLLNPDSIKNTLEQISNSLGDISIVVHNAGFAHDGNFFLMEEDQWNSVIQSNLNSFFYINKEVLSGMISNRWGRIITLASISGEAGNRGQANYAAAKGAVIAATKSLSKEVGRKGITANVVSPGIIETEMTENMLHFDLKQMIPIGRMGRPEEVAAAVLFLASEDASYINGTVLQVNGGLYT